MTYPVSPSSGMGISVWLSLGVAVPCTTLPSVYMDTLPLLARDLGSAMLMLAILVFCVIGPAEPSSILTMVLPDFID